jgi:hypothetical protein
MTKQHYEVPTYRTQENVGYLLKCAQSLAMDVVEPVLEASRFQGGPILGVRDRSFDPKLPDATGKVDGGPKYAGCRRGDS